MQVRYLFYISFNDLSTFSRVLTASPEDLNTSSEDDSVEAAVESFKKAPIKQASISVDITGTVEPSGPLSAGDKEVNDRDPLFPSLFLF